MPDHDIPLESGNYDDDLSPNSSGSETISSVSESEVSSSVAQLLQESVSETIDNSDDPDPIVGSLRNFQRILIDAAKTQDLDSVEEINLLIQSQNSSLQCLSDFLPKLERMSLYGSCIESIREIGFSFERLTILNVGKCNLQSLDGLLTLSSLEELYAERNQISELMPCAFACKLRVIDLKFNLITDRQGIEFLSLCNSLSDLSLEGCPVAEINDYRKIVKYILPRLKSLDGTFFDCSGSCSMSINPPGGSFETKTLFKNTTNFIEIEPSKSTISQSNSDLVISKYSNLTSGTNKVISNLDTLNKSNPKGRLLNTGPECLIRNVIKLPPINNPRPHSTIPFNHRPCSTSCIVTNVPVDDKFKNRPSTACKFDQKTEIADLETIKKQLKNLPALHNPFSADLSEVLSESDLCQNLLIPDQDDLSNTLTDSDDPETLIRLSRAWRVSSASRRNKNLLLEV